MPHAKANQITLALLMWCVIMALCIFFSIKAIPVLAPAIAIVCGILIVIFIISAAVLQFSWECPSCGYKFTNEEVSKEETSSKMGYRTITRREHNHETENPGEWQEQVRVKTVEYLHTYQCSNCGHTWTKTSTQQFQDFDE